MIACMISLAKAQLQQLFLSVRPLHRPKIIVPLAEICPLQSAFGAHASTLDLFNIYVAHFARELAIDAPGIKPISEIGSAPCPCMGISRNTSNIIHDMPSNIIRYGWTMLDCNTGSEHGPASNLMVLQWSRFHLLAVGIRLKMTPDPEPKLPFIRPPFHLSRRTRHL